MCGQVCVLRLLCMHQMLSGKPAASSRELSSVESLFSHIYTYPAVGPDMMGVTELHVRGPRLIPGAHGVAPILPRPAYN